MNSSLKYKFLFVKVFCTAQLFWANNHSFGQARPVIDLEYGFNVGSYSGSLNYERQDIYIPGIELSINAHFNFLGIEIDNDWGFGSGWNFSYNFFYEPDTLGSIVVYKNDGSRHRFTKSDDGFISPERSYDKLEEYASGKYKLTLKKDRLVYYFDDSNNKGLTSIEDRNNNKTTLTYSDSLLSSIKDPFGREIKLKWANGRMVEIVEANASVERYFKYKYDAKGRLIKVTNPIGKTLTYSYDDKSRLIGFTDENTNPLKIEYNSSSAVKKAVTCLYTKSFTYDLKNRKTFVLEDLGSGKVITIFKYDENGRNIERKGNCCGYNVSMEYDNKNNVVKRTDGNSNAYSYLYDENGNLKKVTDPEGNSSNTVFDPQTNKILSQTDALGNTTTYQYDSKGNLTQINHPLGIVEKFTYNQYGLITSSTDENGNITSYTYDSYGYPSKVTYPDNSTYQTTYSPIGNLLSETDENGNITKFEYNVMDWLVKQTNAMENTIDLKYDGKGNIIEYKNEEGDVTTYEYDPMDRLLNTTTPTGITTKNFYDNRGNIIKEVDGMGLQTTYVYNDLDNVVSKTDQAGNVVNYEYDAMGRKISESDKMGNQMTYLYDKLGRLTKKIDPLGNTMEYKYDQVGRKLSETDANGNATLYKYDALGRVVSITDPLGYKELFVYDNRDNLIEETDKNGNKTKYTYDKRDRRLKKEQASGNIVEFTFDGFGNEVTRSLMLGVVHNYKYNNLNQKIEHEAPNGEITKFEYDKAGRLVKETRPNGNIIQKEYDKDGRLLKEWDSEGLLAQFKYNNNGSVIEEIDRDSVKIISQYNNLNQLVEQKDVLGRSQSTAYNPNGLPVEQVDKNGRLTKFVYNNLGIVTEVVDYLNRKTGFKYDAMGNLISITDANNNTTTYTYDKLNRQTSIVYADGTIKEYKYDAYGNIVERINADGSKSTYEYDNLNRQTKKAYPNQGVCSFTYDGLGRLTSAVNSNATVEFEYDVNNRLIKEKVNDANITYQYDANAGKKKITYPTGRIIEELLDKRNRALSVTNKSVNVATLSYQGSSLKKKELANNLPTTFSYNVLNEMVEIEVNPGEVINFKYTYDQLGNKTKKEALHKQNFSELYAYNGSDQLISYKKGEISNDEITNPMALTNFSLDAIGNRLTKTDLNNSIDYVANSVNQYSSLKINGNSKELKYTACGNLESYNQFDYNYDFDNRLIKIGDSISYKYDALGRRFQKVVGSTTTTYYYYHDQLIEETDNLGNTTEYIYAGTFDFLLASVKNNQTNYYHFDALGSIVGISSAGGNIVERYEYNPYGEVSIYDSNYNEINSSSIGNRFYFTGKELDAESGLYYYRSRYYNPELGRFMQRDPISYSGGGMNLYEYVNSNPVNFIDPNGFAKCTALEFGAAKSWGKVHIRGRGAGGRLRGALLSGNLSIKSEGKVCEKCCSPGNTKGTVTTINTTVSGSGNYDINGLTFFPASRALVAAATLAGLELFAGLKISGSGSANIEWKSDCGKVSGEGCGSIKINSSGEISAKAGGTNNTNHRGAFVSFGGSITGFLSHKGCITYSDSGAKKKCTTEWGAKAKAWRHIELSWLGRTVIVSEQWEHDLGNGKSDGCPFFL